MSDGTTHGSAGSVTSAGVGTGGGTELGDGEGDGDGTGDDGDVSAGRGFGDGTAAGAVVCGTRTGAVVAAGGTTRWVRDGGAGAAPMLPAPTGGPAATGRAIGVASVQPIATAIGKPIVTSPKKSGLGDNRTL